MNNKNPITTFLYYIMIVSWPISIPAGDGRCIKQFNNVSGDSFTWNTETMVPGHYFVKVLSGDRQYTAKVLFMK